MKALLLGDGEMMITNKKLVGYFEGVSKGSPGPAGAGAFIVDIDGNTLWETAEYLGIKTTSEAQYNAVVSLLKAALDLSASEIKAVGSNSFVVRQLSCAERIKDPNLRKLAEEAWDLSKKIKVTYVWIPRERNKTARKLSNEAIDKGIRETEYEMVR